MSDESWSPHEVLQARSGPGGRSSGYSFGPSDSSEGGEDDATLGRIYGKVWGAHSPAAGGMMNPR